MAFQKVIVPSENFLKVTVLGQSRVYYTKLISAETTCFWCNTFELSNNAYSVLTETTVFSMPSKTREKAVDRYINSLGCRSPAITEKFTNFLKQRPVREDE